jgi:small basic protein
MKKLFQNTAFIIGFWSVIIILLVLNIIPSETNKFSNIIIDRGFPFLMYREGISSNYSTYVFWSGLVANIVIALVCSFAVGLSFKLIWSRITSRQLS